nr:hypothetical protein [Hymenobacter sp. CA1UV-4]
MFPDPDWQPTHFPQLLVNLAVPFFVARNLGCPEFGIGLGRGAVDGAAMPETAVDKHSDFRLDEKNIRGSW